MPAWCNKELCATALQLLLVFLLLTTRAETTSMTTSLSHSNEMTQICRAFQTGGMERLAEFASPNYPQNYPPNVDCIRVIHAPPDYDIVFRFHEVFRIEMSYEDSLTPARSISSNCPNDYLEIRDGRYSFSPLIGRFCGLEPPQNEIRIRSGYVWLNFHSDSLLEERGFSAEYEFVRRYHLTPQNPQECHFSYALQLDGYINVKAMSDLYKDVRSANQSLECVYQIRVPNYLRVAIFIEQFELAAPNQCSQNFLEIYSGPMAREPLKRYCGIIATHTYTFDTVVFLRAFVASKFHAQQTRLKILFSSYLALKNCSEQEAMFECGDDICIPESLVCNKRTNCLYKRDESVCYEYKNFLTTLLLDSSFILLPVLIVVVLLLFTFIYKPCLTHSLSSQILEVEARKGTSLTSTRLSQLNTKIEKTPTNARTKNKCCQTDVSQSLSLNRISSVASKKLHSIANETTENGKCWQTFRLPATMTTTKADVWQAADEGNMDQLETSFVTIDV